MSQFLNENYLLSTETGRMLYHDVAKNQPIVDFHNHLSSKDIAQDRVWENLTDVWIGDSSEGGDYYKWRTMRWCGIPEALISDARTDPYERFQAWAKVVPQLMRSPLYTWTHLELRRVFGIDTLLNPDTAQEVWQEANRQLPQLSARALLKCFNVTVVGTTDDPTDSLKWHRICDQAFRNGELGTQVVPTFRPDKAHDMSNPQQWIDWSDRLADITNVTIEDWPSLRIALATARADFIFSGCRASDHSFMQLPTANADSALADVAIKTALAGEWVPPNVQQALASCILEWVSRANHAEDCVTQLHLGPLRNVSPTLLQTVGRDAGGDVISDVPQAEGLSHYLGALDCSGHLPRTILYNLDPAQNAIFAAMAGAYQQTGSRGHVQMGSGWWFMGQEDGMRKQIECLSQIGVLSTFVGTLTDSRSFLSFSRHELFRRILCDMIGKDVDQGKLPADIEILSGIVRGICCQNALDYFGFSVQQES